MTPQPVRIGKMSESELNEIAKESYRQITGKQPPATAPNGTISTCDVSILHGSCPICPQHLTCKNPQKRIIQQQPAACGAGRHEVREDGIERHSGDGAADSGEDAAGSPMTDRSKRNITPGKGEISTFMDCLSDGNAYINSAGVMVCNHQCNSGWFCLNSRNWGTCPRGYAR